MAQSILRRKQEVLEFGPIGQCSAECFTKHCYCLELDTEQVL